MWTAPRKGRSYFFLMYRKISFQSGRCLCWLPRFIDQIFSFENVFFHTVWTHVIHQSSGVNKRKSHVGFASKGPTAAPPQTIVQNTHETQRLCMKLRYCCGFKAKINRLWKPSAEGPVFLQELHLHQNLLIGDKGERKYFSANKHFWLVSKRRFLLVVHAHWLAQLFLMIIMELVRLLTLPLRLSLSHNVNQAPCQGCIVYLWHLYLAGEHSNAVNDLQWGNTGRLSGRPIYYQATFLALFCLLYTVIQLYKLKSQYFYVRSVQVT